MIPVTPVCGSGSCEQEDAELAQSLVGKVLKMRHHILTEGVWLSGFGACKEDERTDEGVVHQISVLHEDGFVRTYTVSDEDFAVIGDCDPDSIELDRRAAQCFIDNKAEKVSKKTIEERMNSRHFKGGCEEAQKIIAEKGELKDLTGMRIQYWDTTQAGWYAGKIVGMWHDRPNTHFLALFDDETEYAVDSQKDAWKLEPGGAVVPAEQFDAGGFGRFMQIKGPTGMKEYLEFIVLTKAPKQRLHVYCNKYNIRVYKEARVEGSPPWVASGDADSSDDESEEEVSEGADQENEPVQVQAASGSVSQTGKHKGAKWWNATSDRPLSKDDLKVTVVNNDDGNPVALKALVPVETDEQEKASKGKAGSTRRAAGARV